MESGDLMNLYAIRHGETDWNKNFVLQGLTDIPLNENGIKQAQKASLQLKDIVFDYVFVSPLTRTKQTLNELDLTCTNVIETKEIIERDFGEFEGTQANVREYWNYELNLSLHNVEPIKALFRRTYIFLEKIIKNYGNTGSNIILVTHNGVQMAINFLLSNDFPLNGDILSLRVPPCTIKKYANPVISEERKRFLEYGK